jgi:uncharacterized Tic20 family protein
MSVPGWYPDPAGSPQQRYWDGERWTDALAGATPATTGTLAGPTAPAPLAADSTRWAMAAHLSALIALIVGFVFVGPLIVYLVKKDDPYVRRHAAEALNFNLSVTLYAIVGGLVLLVLILLLVGILLIPLAFIAGIVWIVLVVVAAVRASKGEDYRYPLTIRFVS